MAKADATELSIGKKILGIMRSVFIYLLALAIVVAALLFAADKSPTKSIFGYRYYTVITPSMDPTLKVGDIVVVKVGGVSDVKKGDIITFNPSSGSSSYLTHRVTQVLPDYFGDGVTCFKTKGDANEDEDGFLLDESRVIGKVKFHIPKLGYVVRFIQLKWYLVLPLFIVFLLFLHLIKLYVNGGGDGEDEDASAESKEKAPSESKESASAESAGGEEPDNGEASTRNLDLGGISDSEHNADSEAGAESEQKTE